METKKCSKCSLVKDISNFTIRGYNKNGEKLFRSECKECRKKEYKENENFRNDCINRAKLHYQKNKERYKKNRKENYYNNLELNLWKNAKLRAEKHNLPFNLEISDIVIPKKCPVLGIDLIANGDKGKRNSPSLDKIIPSLGYVKGNVIVVSLKANTIKNDATIDELKKVYLFYKKIIKK